ncbi:MULTISPECIES: putative leader peptide [Amycolatopsis]|uniref:Uncharacterized protein n=1 Tax=Amycolatopsis magusensis TaxID=882444 RepID=A0ABS4PKQ4_9PSEU|nr:hypothetical protein [Amycolatopsis magusensis]
MTTQVHLLDVIALVQRRHIDLVRVDSALCRR